MGKGADTIIRNSPTSKPHHSITRELKYTMTASTTNTKAKVSQNSTALKPRSLKNTCRFISCNIPLATVTLVVVFSKRLLLQMQAPSKQDPAKAMPMTASSVLLSHRHNHKEKVSFFPLLYSSSLNLCIALAMANSCEVIGNMDPVFMISSAVSSVKCKLV